MNATDQGHDEARGRGLVPPALVARAFEGPRPGLEWTGDGVRRCGGWSRLQLVRHAMACSAELVDGACVSSLDVAKLLLIHCLRTSEREDLRAWIASYAMRGVPHGSVGVLLVAARRPILAGEDLVLAWDPVCGHTRVVWPWGAHTDVSSPAFMRAAWRSYFEAPEQPELRTQLLRWRAR